MDAVIEKHKVTWDRCDRRGCRRLDGGRWLAVASAEGDSTQKGKEKKGCRSEHRVQIPLEQDGWQDLQYPKMNTALPADCTAWAVCMFVCACVWTHGVTDSYAGGNDGLFFPSRCLSGVLGLLCCGCSYSQRMNCINENSLLLLKPAGGTWIEAACKHGELQSKRLIPMWSARPPLFTFRDALQKKSLFFFSLSWGVQELLLSLSYFSTVIFSLRLGSSEC